jgi:phosphate:Na+ symporter
MLGVGWRQADSRRMALANLILKLVMVALLLIFQAQAIALLTRLPGGMTQHIAYAHAGFNILVAIMGLPLLYQVYALAHLLAPAAAVSGQPVFGPRYIQDAPGDSASLALGQSQREIIRVSEIVRQMLDDLWLALKNNDEAKARDIARQDDQVDLLDARIKRYLAQLGSEMDEIANSREQINQLTYLTELESIGDIIDKNLSELVIKKIKLHAQFTDQGWQELDDFYHKVARNLLIADTAFATRDKLLAQQLLRHKDYLRKYEQELRDRHFARLNSRLPQSHETSAIHLDILTHLKRINSGVSHVGYAILRDDRDAEDNREVRTRSE